MPPVDFSQLPVAIPVLIASLTVHEAAHAWCADVLGDPTPAKAGRVSLSPVAHFELTGMLLIPIAAKLAGVGFLGWGRTIPFAPRETGPHWRRNAWIVWAAGPISNLALAAVAAFSFRAGGAALDGALAILVWQAIQLNALLAAVNVIPVPPLDAGNALLSMFELDGAASSRWFRVAGPIVVLALLATGVIGAVVTPLRGELLEWLL